MGDDNDERSRQIPNLLESPASTHVAEKLWRASLHPQFETSQLFYGFICGAVFAFGAWNAWLGYQLGLYMVWWEPMPLILTGAAIVSIIAYRRVGRALQAEVAEFAKMVRCRWGASEEPSRPLWP